ncbi:S49 family peptidase [Prosthecobacter sp.]|uniref:S49 family peptidase n=1 Tax=Prosthecobacter sp. TaxID=1965333 RepID=UPI003784DE5D
MKPALHAHAHALPRIAARLYAEPWLLRDLSYASLQSQFRAALQNRNQPKLGYLSEEDDDEDDDCTPTKLQQQADMDCLADIIISQGIAIVPITGILGKHLSLLETMCGGFDLDVLNAQCNALTNRADVRTIIFHFNTPGGAAAGVAESAECIQSLTAHGKHTIAYCDEACSGGMWLAAACDEIVCGQTAVLGSISALCAILDESKAFEMEGLQMQVFTDGAFKGAGIEGTTLTAAQRDDIQNRVNYIGGQFKTYITTRRPSVKPETMQGQWFYGLQAQEYGLADTILPTLEHCIAAAMM